MFPVSIRPMAMAMATPRGDKALDVKLAGRQAGKAAGNVVL